MNPVSDEDRRYLAQNALMTLMEARRLRSDTALMADVRALVREEREHLGALLDEL